jgi:hypothetical protein
MSLLDHWQTLVGSLLGAILGFAAAIWTVRVTLLSEDRRAEREARSIRRSLTAELRQIGLRALDGYHACKALSESPGGVRIEQLENAARFPDPVVYPTVAAHLDAIGANAETVVFFYGSIDLIRQAFERARQAHGTSDVPGGAMHELCRSLIDMCRALKTILPDLAEDPKAGPPTDRELLSELGSAVDLWDGRKEKSGRS